MKITLRRPWWRTWSFAEGGGRVVHVWDPPTGSDGAWSGGRRRRRWGYIRDSRALPKSPAVRHQCPSPHAAYPARTQKSPFITIIFLTISITFLWINEKLNSLTVPLQKVPSVCTCSILGENFVKKNPLISIKFIFFYG